MPKKSREGRVANAMISHAPVHDLWRQILVEIWKGKKAGLTRKEGIYTVLRSKIQDKEDYVASSYTVHHRTIVYDVRGIRPLRAE